jgi:phage recombination protein Bet
MNDLQKTSALTDSDIKTLEQAGIIPSGTPAAQISVFAATCKERGLSPFTKEVYLVGYGGKYSIITGINGFRKIASESREHAGTDDVIFNLKPDGTYKTAADLKSAAEKPTTATCTVYRIVSGVRCPFTHTAVFSEFASARNPKWNEMPFQMIGKVAEAFALRKGFSDRLTGLNVEEETAALEGVTIEAAHSTNAAASINPQELEARIANTATVEVLMEIYKEHPGHAAFAQLFTERKEQILDQLQIEGKL